MSSINYSTISDYCSSCPAPAGWLLCDGAPVSRAAFPDLWNAIGFNWGGADNTPGSEVFYVPDLRAKFLRGVMPDSGYDRTVARPGAPIEGNTTNQVGSNQGDGIRSHNHELENGPEPIRYDNFGSARSKVGWGFNPAIAMEFTYSATPYSPQEYLEEITMGRHLRISQNLEATGDTRPLNAYVNYLIKVINL